MELWAVTELDFKRFTIFRGSRAHLQSVRIGDRNSVVVISLSEGFMAHLRARVEDVSVDIIRVDSFEDTFRFCS